MKISIYFCVLKCFLIAHCSAQEWILNSEEIKEIEGLLHTPDGLGFQSEGHDFGDENFIRLLLSGLWTASFEKERGKMRKRLAQRYEDFYRGVVLSEPQYIDHFRSFIDGELNKDPTSNLEVSIALSGIAGLKTPEALRLIASYLDHSGDQVYDFNDWVKQEKHEKVDGIGQSFYYHEGLNRVYRVKNRGVSQAAALALAKADLVNAIENFDVPRLRKEMKEKSAAYLPEWRQWWNEIERGERTFQFVGDSLVYGATGPGYLPNRSSMEDSTIARSNRAKDKRNENTQVWWWTAVVLCSLFSGVAFLKKKSRRVKE